MTDSARKALDFGGLDDFQPTRPAERPQATAEEQRRVVDRASTFPSREPEAEGQLNIRAPNDMLTRFKAAAKKDRYTYGAFLEILLNSYEERA
ncbi:hypothetical protein S2M10_24610 [Sphingomonas sp. S2M10]|jgi:hypothetical protein|uniref:hypothetical protein n=1 Tax=Sphingomonas sp. S2M10 TaxID=2705010 RepID=UPI0014564523|nr:hypothetical protein [Sphingomonas sp. S2M10]NLS27465.1 hypothetical protein [Sphingomonas sp. S2M10]